MNSFSNVVRAAIGIQVGLSPALIRPTFRLREDLGLTPLDLVWIVMRAETIELSSDEFPIERLAEVGTVAELVHAFEIWASERDTEVPSISDAG
jgi:hypothetical protein